MLNMSFLEQNLPLLQTDPEFMLVPVSRIVAGLEGGLLRREAGLVQARLAAAEGSF